MVAGSRSWSSGMSSPPRSVVAATTGPPGESHRPDPRRPGATRRDLTYRRQGSTVRGDGGARPEPVPPAADTPPGSLEATTLIEGHGPPAADGDTLRVHYVLVTADGTVVDSSWERGEPFALTLGAGEVIAGWDQGLVGARAGERRRLVVGSDLAYGHEGSSGDDVPPDAPLAFEVDVVEILPGG
jgi:peptidylprolyl isomerase